MQTFELGTVVMTRGVESLVEQGLELATLFRRHATGDWGDLEKEDKDRNNAAILNGAQILSSYNTAVGKIWIITEADRSVTTALLPSEY